MRDVVPPVRNQPISRTIALTRKQALFVCPSEQGVQHPVEADVSARSADHEPPLIVLAIVPSGSRLQFLKRGGRNVVKLACLVTELRGAAMELDKALPEGKLKEKPRLVMRDGEEVIKQHAIGVGPAQPIEAIAHTLRQVGR
jgi:hypothetical protein